MNEEVKDKGLKQAVKEQYSFKLPSNFTYRTMLKVEEAVRLREKKIERRTLWATIVAAMIMVGSSIAGLIIYFGSSIRAAFNPDVIVNIKEFQIPPFYLLLILAVPLFFWFDRWMRKSYFKRHS